MEIKPHYRLPKRDKILRLSAPQISYLYSAVASQPLQHPTDCYQNFLRQSLLEALARRFEPDFIKHVKETYGVP